MIVTLTRVAYNKGTTDDGVDYDYTRLYCLKPIYDRSANEFGVAPMPYEYGDYEKHKELMHLKGKLPLQVEIDYVDFAKGKSEIKQVTLFRVLNDKQPTKS